MDSVDSRSRKVVEVSFEDSRLADSIFLRMYKKQEPEEVTGDSYTIVNLHTPEGKFRSLVNDLNQRFLLFGTTMGNIIISRVNDRRGPVTGCYCYRVHYQDQRLGSLTKIKQNTAIGGSILAKIVGHECKNLNERLFDKATDGTHRFAW